MIKAPSTTIKIEPIFYPRYYKYFISLSYYQFTFHSHFRFHLRLNLFEHHFHLSLLLLHHQGLAILNAFYLKEYFEDDS